MTNMNGKKSCMKFRNVGSVKFFESAEKCSHGLRTKEIPDFDWNSVIEHASAIQSFHTFSTTTTTTTETTTTLTTTETTTFSTKETTTFSTKETTTIKC